MARLSVLLLSVSGCILIINDDPAALRVRGPATTSDASASMDDSAAMDASAGYPDATPLCIPPFIKASRAACFSCLAVECTNEFDACCADSACKSATRFSETPLLSAIDVCEIDKCGSICNGVECHQSPGICSCIAVSPLPTDDAKCSVSTVPGAICCASFEWPMSGSCECSGRAACPSGLKLTSRCFPW
jgi:hypothetical protein